MAERPERAHRQKLLCTATATPDSTTSTNGMRLLAVCSPRLLSLYLCHAFFDEEGVPNIHATQAYVAVIDTD